MFFGQYLLEKGVIDGSALLEALVRQRELNLSLEAFAAREGLLDEAQARAVAAEYRSSRKSIDQILLDRGLLTQPQVRSLEDLLVTRRARIGDILVEIGHLESDQLDQHLTTYKKLDDQRRRALKADFEQIEDGELTRAFLDLAVFHLERVLESTVKLASVTETHRPTGPDERRFVQHLRGDREMWIALDIPEALTGSIGAQMLGIEVESGSELSYDVARELVNLISGNACVELERQDVHLKPEAPAGAEAMPAPDRIERASHSLLETGSSDLHVHLFFCRQEDRG